MDLVLGGFVRTTSVRRPSAACSHGREADDWGSLDGIVTLRREDRARVFVTACRLCTGDTRYGWANTVVGVLDGVLERVGVGGAALGRPWGCRATLT